METPNAYHVSLPEPSGIMDGVADEDTRNRAEQGALRVPKGEEGRAVVHANVLSLFFARYT